MDQIAYKKTMSHESIVDDDDNSVLEESMPENNQMKKIWKCAGLAFISILVFLILFTYNNPGPLQTRIMDDLSYSAVDFSYLMSSNAWASGFCFLGGYFVDRLVSLNIGLYTFLGIFCLGNLLYSIGIFTKTYSVIIIGRILNGFGGESMLVITCPYILHWFSDGKLNLAFAIVCCFGLVESAFTFMICNPLYEFMLHQFDKSQTPISRHLPLGITIILISGLACLLAVASSLAIGLIYNKTFKSFENKISTEDNRLKTIKEIFKFPFHYWTLIISISLINSAMYTFFSFSVAFYTNRYGMTIDNADDITALSSVVMFITSPVIGILIDKTGGNIFYLGASCLGSVASHALLAFTQFYPTMPVVALSFSMSIFISSYCPPIVKAVKSHQISTAFGVSNSLTNFNVGFVYMAAGYIIDEFGYQVLEYFYASLLTGAFVFCALTWMLQFLSLPGHDKLRSPKEPGQST